MKILAIRGRNLASLAGDFTVDFEQEPLKSAGLFAISGPTGAGKSTLLDALCMALYEETPRLFKAGNRNVPDVGDATVTQQDARNLLRRGCAEGHAEVDFIGNDGQIYRARWSVRRSRGKASGSLQKTTMTLLHLPDLQPLGGTNKEVLAEIAVRIGLSFEQFTRAVLLAQNEFSAFLKADDNERGELLETLTGSAIYSTLSQRAFGRHREEQAALQRLADRLADQRPLSEEARSQLDEDSAAADATLAALDLQLAAVTTRLRWYQDHERLRLAEQQAQAQWQQDHEAQQAAAPRRAELQLLEAIQPARALVDDIDRLTRTLEQDRLTIAASRAAMDQAELARLGADASLALAQAGLASAEQAQQAAAPALDQAKVLDTRIDTLLLPHELARQAQADATRVAEQAQRQALTRQGELALARQAQQAHALWLEQNAAWQALAQDWSRGDLLLGQATRSDAEVKLNAQLLATLAADHAQQTTVQASTAAALAQAAQVLADAGHLRQQAVQQLAAIDLVALKARKDQLELRRERWHDGDQLWRTLTEQQTRLQQLDAQCRASLQAAIDAEAAAAQAEARSAPLAAAMAQAEQSLKHAEAACTASVESLRDALVDDAPCPVCGAADHPYVQANGPLHALLEKLQDDVAVCREQHQQARHAQATLAAQAGAHRQQLAGIAPQQQQLQQLHDQLQRDWSAHPVALALDGAEPATWLSAERADLDSALATLKTQDTAGQRALQARDAAQASFEQALTAHALCNDAAQAASARLAATVAGQHTAGTQLSLARHRLDQALVPLDAVLAATQADWRAAWQAAPDDFHARCRDAVRLWQERRTASDQLTAQCTDLATGLAALTTAASTACAEQQRCSNVFNTGAATISALQAERRLLFDGQPVREIESRLAGAITAARSSLLQASDASNTARDALARHTEALAQASRHLAAHEHEAQSAATRLDAWLANLDDTIELDAIQLRTLLAQSMPRIADLRNALHALDNAVQQAAAVLRERTGQGLAHAQQRPPAEDGESPDSVQLALQTLTSERQLSHARATELQLALRQDQSRRLTAADLLGALAGQEATCRVWAQLSDLIGSADGKKLRNYAQQTTLDVLLGYANRHLHALAKRYRLQRIRDTLALMVIDQDMGNDMRSVHSLSGGESFLVSLALALGLASLSSNRVRVESLFIDEGFGSLDADTLRVAMDALDGLQAMGRKVGVISHVQEMTERIATKVLVERVAGGSSRVAVG
ncbi:Exonuclease SbcC [Oxalobacteraceae bacterium IMCC9480]|nr:Exonuclease SbcC [Oxalobacteraceae bacterium IMCC9480]